MGTELHFGETRSLPWGGYKDNGIIKWKLAESIIACFHNK